MYEGYKANIPSEIMEKMGSGFVLTDKEKEIVRQHGKVYVLAYIKRKDGELIKPQLRDLPKRSGLKGNNIGGWKIGKQSIPIIPRDYERLSDGELSNLIQRVSKISGTTIQNIPPGKDKNEWLRRMNGLYRERGRRGVARVEGW